MKAGTLAAAAALVGAVSAGHQAHEHLHKRQDWSDDPATSSTTTDWTTSASTTTSSSTDWDPASTTVAWEDWTTTSSSSSSSVTDWDPNTSTTTSDWEDWTTTTTSSAKSAFGPWDPKWTKDGAKASCTATVTDWALGTATVTSVVTATETDAWVWSWGPYTSTTTVTVTATWAWGSSSTTPVAAVSTSSSAWAWPYDPSECSVTVLTSTGAPVWLPDPSWTSYSTVYVTPVAAAATTSASEWADWTSTTTTTTPAAAWSADPSEWADWSSTTTTTTPVAAWSADPSEWADWSSSSTASSWPAWSSPADPDWEWSSTTTATSASATWPAWTSSSSAVSSPTGHAIIKPSGNNWAMTYSPYTASSGCKDQGTISADIAIIASKGFTSVRVYSTDCKTLEFVGQACRDNGLKIILGVFISSTGISGAGQQVTDILAWAQWDIVELIVVGNEAVFNGYVSASDLAWFITSVKGQVSGAGYTGPVTTTEPLTTWQSVGTTFCSAVDVVAANLYAFFNAETTADQAGTFIESEITILEGICSSLDVYVMETGWPTAGECNGLACPGWTEQATAITGIQQTSGAKVVFFSYEDDAWKEPGQFGVEQHWGCVNVFGDASPSYTTTSAASTATGW